MNLINILQSKRSQAQESIPYASSPVKVKNMQDKFVAMAVWTGLTLAGLGIDWEEGQGHLLWWWIVNIIDRWESYLQAQVQ